MSAQDSNVPPAPHQPGGRRGKKKIHVAGTVYGSWTLIREGEPTPRSVTRWWCRCKCGREQLNQVALLISGATKGCRECAGLSKKPEGVKLARSSYQSMRHRCLNPACEQYPRYGGRGITICDRWLESFENFLADMGERPSTRFSIDRIEGTGNYEPGNCRWASKRAQARNSKSNVLIKRGDEVLCAVEWGERLGINPATICNRLRNGRTPEEALTVGRLYKYGKKGGRKRPRGTQAP